VRRIALATCAHHPGFCAGDDAPLLDAFAALGADAALLRWDDPDIDWSSFDAVVIRTTWDYAERLDEFLAWVDRVDSVTRILNPPSVVRANLDKLYLRELEKADVPIVPTQWLAPSDAGGVEAMLRDAGWSELVIKPTVGAGASGLGRFTADRFDDAVDHATDLLRRGSAMAQPWLDSITTRGEVSVVLLNGEISHTVRKVPKAGDFRVQIEFGGVYTLVEPSEREAEIALRAHGLIAGDEAPLLYARADIVEPSPGERALIEFEAVEPELFFPMAQQSAQRFAALSLERLATV